MKARRGYTIVELMMAIAVFAVGLTGIAAMQTLAARGNTHAKNLAIATSVARSWQERLSMDGLRWGGPSRWPISNTDWLNQVTIGNNAWFVPASLGNSSAGADALGNPVAASSPDLVFCTHVRLTQMIRQPESGLIRAEVRVFWLKPVWNVAGSPDSWAPASGDPAGFCDTQWVNVLPTKPVFYSIYKTSVIRETPAF